ncbi:hypothetical protein J6590_100124 [Homalodisca vitripennis]|nr:hypothetical protein J6590_100124 [Homalodisca vitripennis]
MRGRGDSDPFALMPGAPTPSGVGQSLKQGAEILQAGGGGLPPPPGYAAPLRPRAEDGDDFNIFSAGGLNPASGRDSFS